MPTKQDFLNFIKTQPYWTIVWDQSDLDNWAAGREPGHLDTLWNAFQLGSVMPTINFIYVESGHNLENPLWVNWGDTGIKPEVVALQNGITDLINRKAQYQAAGGNDTVFMSKLQSEIDSLSATLKQYQGAPGANS